VIPAALKLLPWKAILQFSVLALVVALVVWTFVRAWGVLPDTRHSLEQAEAALKAEVACEEGSACAAREQELKKRAKDEQKLAVEALNAELEELRRRPIPHRVIRVCNDRDLRDAPGSAGAGSGSAAQGVVHAADELDTRPLRELAQRADELSAQLRSLLRRDRALATPPEK